MVSVYNVGIDIKYCRNVKGIDIIKHPDYVAIDSAK